jgi:hypothetical protein
MRTLPFIGWLIVLVILPRFAKVSFSRVTGVFAALDGVPPQRLDDTVPLTEKWANVLALQIVALWVLLGIAWLYKNETLEMVVRIFGGICLILWIIAIQAVRKASK